MKKILVINAHPYHGTASILADEYIRGAEEAGHKVRAIKLRELKYDPILRNGYKKEQPLEPDLQKQQENITWAEHLVIFTPIWWGNLPALAKGFIDRTFLPGFAFKFESNSPMPKKLLKGRSAHLFYTQGAPKAYSNIVLGDGFWTMFKSVVLKFTGFSPVRRTIFDQAGRSGAEVKMESWRAKVYEAGKMGK